MKSVLEGAQVAISVTFRTEGSLEAAAEAGFSSSLQHRVIQPDSCNSLDDEPLATMMMDTNRLPCNGAKASQGPSGSSSEAYRQESCQSANSGQREVGTVQVLYTGGVPLPSTRCACYDRTLFVRSRPGLPHSVLRHKRYGIIRLHPFTLEDIAPINVLSCLHILF